MITALFSHFLLLQVAATATDDRTSVEYDYTILDSISGYGSPYGGFSRATQARLASLPLHLPEISVAPTDENEDEDDADKNEGSPSARDDNSSKRQHMQVTDASGQMYACRIYQEDELEPSTWHDSMFDPPVLRQTKTGGKSPALLPDGSTATTVMTADNNNNNKMIPSSSSSSSSSRSISTLESISRLQQTEMQLSQLEGVCAQIHKGWWSYEWCYRAAISQFHLSLEKKNGQVTIESVSTLGRFQSRRVYVSNLDTNPDTIATSGTPNHMMNWVGEDQVELSRVVDEYTLDGDLCEVEEGEEEDDVDDENNSKEPIPRKAYVHMQCCAASVLEAKNRRGLLHKNGQVLLSSDAVLMQIVEKPVCTYNLTVCTPLLCQSSLWKGGEGSSDIAMQQQQQQPQQPSNAAAAALVPGKDETVRDILQRALGNYCLQTETGGWWTYEFCHGRKVRQYHEAIGTAKTEAGSVVMTRTVESEHLLGLFDPSTYNAGEDWQFVVNATDSGKGAGDGNGAYFEVEYTNGDVCDHSDVTDSAIIAGNVGLKGVERAASIRYFCGPSYSISVREDSTCHYVVDVHVPDLCQHKLFVAPVSKKQIVKCLPVD